MSSKQNKASFCLLKHQNVGFKIVCAGVSYGSHLNSNSYIWNISRTNFSDSYGTNKRLRDFAENDKARLFCRNNLHLPLVLPNSALAARGFLSSL